MVIQGGSGPALRAFGEAGNRARADAFARVTAERLERQRRTGPEELLPPLTETARTARVRARAHERGWRRRHVARARRACLPGLDLVFGAVYEYVDSAGQPRLVGSTGGQPEKTFMIDREDNASVGALLRRDTRAQAQLVWAGIGRRSRGCGEGERAESCGGTVGERGTLAFAHASCSAGASNRWALSTAPGGARELLTAHRDAGSLERVLAAAALQ